MKSIWMSRVLYACLLLNVLSVTASFAQDAPKPTPGDFVVKNYKFESGESLPELKIHYVTLGTAQKNKDGMVTNAVLVLHGTGGSNTQFLGRGFAGVLFGKGQLLDAAKYFIVIPDNVGHGAS